VAIMASFFCSDIVNTSSETVILASK